MKYARRMQNYLWLDSFKRWTERNLFECTMKMQHIGFWGLVLQLTFSVEIAPSEDADELVYVISRMKYILRL